ncbi:uncharacterized protein LOC115886925 isoform X3 [Sitophilus oryzae]|uniref:Uncharacterized protein LOC115886925 isoform X3 n=1 Tax=Sitophilus oryzae TaxID=7048 RepID=A0A6J2YG68_SITOR|nr:uncharacterized protein LOC115886925 isoform X3 [Sitophilus oryzae]
MAKQNINFDYFWRDYNEILPADAYPGGVDTHGQNVYVGLASVEEIPGVYPTAIRPGKTVVVPIDGRREASKFKQILLYTGSKQPERLKWMTSGAALLSSIPKSNHLILAGIEGRNRLYIGRQRDQGEIVIGKILTDDVNNVLMWYANDHTEASVSTYEILTYDTSVNVDFDIK